MSPPPPLPNTESRPSRAERTRARILMAAGHQFAAAGYAATRLEDVGEDVGIGRSAVLYHFKDKKHLYRAVLEDLFGGLFEAQRTSILTKGSLTDRLEAMVCNFVDFMGRRPTAARLAMRELVNIESEIREELHAQIRPFLELIEVMFAEGKSSGEFHPVCSDAYHFLSIIAGSTLFYIAALPNLIDDLPYDPLSREQLDAHQRDLLEMTRRLLGIRGPR